MATSIDFEALMKAERKKAMEKRLRESTSSIAQKLSGETPLATKSIEGYRVGHLKSVFYIPNWVTKSEEEELISSVQKCSQDGTKPWANLPQRRLQNWGGALMEFSQGLISAAYIVAALLFIFSLSGLSKQETAETGNWYGIIGMSIALIATIADPRVDNVLVIFVAMSVGAFIGLHLAKKVEMTQMPELVAILHSFVGLAAVLVGFNSYFEADHNVVMTAVQHTAMKIHLAEVFLGIFIGAVTFTGSIVAFGKLRGIIDSSALMLPHRHKMNLAAGIFSFLLLLTFVNNDGSNQTRIKNSP